MKEKSINLVVYKNDLQLKFSDKADNSHKDELVLLENQINKEIGNTTKSSYPTTVMKKYGLRKAITSFSDKSRKRLLFVMRNSLCSWTHNLTLTYPKAYPLNGRTCKRHLNTLLTHLRKDYPKIKYVWFLEFQKRGAPHFHIMLTCGIPQEKYASPLWARITKSGDFKHLKAGTQVKKFSSDKDLLAFIANYAGKKEQKDVPENFTDIGRFWGSSHKLVEGIVSLENVSSETINAIRVEYNKQRRFNIPKQFHFRYIWDGVKWISKVLSRIKNYVKKKIEDSLLSKLKRLKNEWHLINKPLYDTKRLTLFKNFKEERFQKIRYFLQNLDLVKKSVEN